MDSVGCYVPGGRYPLVSTLLMTVIPAQVAGVQRIRVVSPQPRADVLAAAGMLGVREVYRVGGAQAIAALAYGTQAFHVWTRSSVQEISMLLPPRSWFLLTVRSTSWPARPKSSSSVMPGHPSSLPPTWLRRRSTIRKRSQFLLQLVPI